MARALTLSLHYNPQRLGTPEGATSPALPQGMRTRPGAGGGREPGRPAARRLPSPALRCLQSCGSELHAWNAPPPPQTPALKLLSPGPSDPKKAPDSSPKLLSGPETQAPTHRSKTTNALRFTPFGRLILIPSPVNFPLFSRLSNAFRLHLPTLPLTPIPEHGTLTSTSSPPLRLPHSLLHVVLSLFQMPGIPAPTPHTFSRTLEPRIQPAQETRTVPILRFPAPKVLSLVLSLLQTLPNMSQLQTPST